MHFRCGSCHAAVWFQPTTRTKTVITFNRAIVKCRTCSQEYNLGSTLDRIDLTAFHQDALVLAKSSEIDLQAAYSVLLRILSLDEVKDGCDPSLCTADSGREVGFDHAFEEAVNAGHLTPAQAMQRGDRAVFAKKLVQRHRLPLEQALAVADNRIPLLAAIRARKPKGRIKVDPGRTRKSAMPLVMAAAAILVVGVFIALNWSPGEAAKAEARPDSERAELTTVEVKVNLEGEPTEVSGQNPESILAAFCESASSSGEKVPVGVEPSNDDWTGLYREGGTLYAVRIRRDSLRDLWVAGDAVEPIEATRGVRDHEPEGLSHHSSAARKRIVVERNLRGAVLRVSAADPTIVLRAYCQVHAGGAGCEPLELRSGIPVNADLRLGVFRDFSEQELKITIRREHTRWIAGDGNGLIEVALAG